MKLSLPNIVPTRIKKFTAYNFLDGFSFLPMNIALLVTYRCNNRCKICLYYGRCGICNDKKEFEELNFDQTRQIIDNIANFKTKIEISGGEPFMRDDLLKIIMYIKQKGCYCSLFTNGALINKENCKEIVNSKLDKICISIDGPEEIHDELRGTIGCFKKAVNAIALLTEQRTTEKPRIEMWFTVSNMALGHLGETIKLAKTLRVDSFVIKSLWYSNDRIIKEHNKVLKNLFDVEMNNIKGMNIEGVDHNLVAEKLKEIDIKDNFAKFLPRLSKEDMVKFYLDPAIVVKQRCKFPWVYASIKPNGDLSCCYHDFVIGNLKTNDFRSLWNNEKARYFRRALKKRRHFPVCLRCGGMFSA